MSVFDIYIQQIVNGLILGSFYALIALGYSMVYGIIKMLNFAHGDIYMFGAFGSWAVFYFAANRIGTEWACLLFGVLAAICLCAALGFLIQRVAYRPLFNAPRLSLMIVAIGVSLVLENAMMLLTNGESVYLNLGINMTAGVMIGHVSVKWIQIILFAIAVVVMVGLTLLINYTKWGQAMRAVSEDMNTCRLMGINANRIIALTFIIGSMLAAVAGTMNGIYYGSLKYDMGYMMGIKAFTAAVIGGIGSIPGAMLGGILLGVLEAPGTQICGSAWKDVFAFGLLIVMLVFKPNGIFGLSETERM